MPSVSFPAGLQHSLCPYNQQLLTATPGPLCLRVFSSHRSVISPCLGQAGNAKEVMSLGAGLLTNDEWKLVNYNSFFLILWVRQSEAYSIFYIFSHSSPMDCASIISKWYLPIRTPYIGIFPLPCLPFPTPLPVITSQINCLYSNPCLMVSFWEPNGRQ